MNELVPRPCSSTGYEASECVSIDHEFLSSVAGSKLHTEKVAEHTEKVAANQGEKGKNGSQPRQEWRHNTARMAA